MSWRSTSPSPSGCLGTSCFFPACRAARRLFALMMDCGFLSWQLHLGGEVASLFFPIYLWIIFGNGFRFGLASLAVAIPVATVCFGIVVCDDPLLVPALAPFGRAAGRARHPAGLCRDADPQALPGDGGGRGGQPGQEPLPRERQPRIAHAAHGHRRHDGTAAGHARSPPTSATWSRPWMSPPVRCSR